MLATHPTPPVNHRFTLGGWGARVVVVTTTSTLNPAVDWDAFEFALITADQAGPVGHLDPACRRAEGGPVTPTETPWPCGTCVPVSRTNSTSIYTIPDFVPSRDSDRSGATAARVSAPSGRETEGDVPTGPEALHLVRQEAAERAVKYELGDVTETRMAAAVEYAATYTGDFEFMVEMRAEATKARGLHGHLPAGLSAGQAKGVLNCLRADARRAPAAADTPTAPAAGVRVNQYAGTCVCCGAEVATGAGTVEKAGGKWETRHPGAPDGCPTVEFETDYAGGRPRPVNQPTPAAPLAQTAPLPDVPEGRYAVETADSHIAFYKVDKPTDGRWAGYTFVTLLVGAPGSFNEQRIPKTQTGSVLARIAADVVGAALLFSRKFTCCSRCLAPLSLVQSRATGFGSTCAGKLGVRYLPRAEALRVLDEQGISTDGLEDL